MHTYQSEQRFVLELLGQQNRLPAVGCLDQLRDLISEYGFLVPVLVTKAGQIVSGCEQMLAACSLGWERVPCLLVESMDPEDLALYKGFAADQLVTCEWDAIAASLS
jgi:hypothetical protein